MKVAFVIEYFPPFAPGGGEWSTFYLAKNLVKSKTNVVVITPNLGAKNEEIISGVKIRRFPFYLKLENKCNLPGNFSYTNPLWLVWSTFFYFKYLKEEKPDIIHVQGKYSIPPIIIANILLKKPIVATIRDYIVVCNYGMCLISKDIACSLKEYFFDDFKKYYKLYISPNNYFTFFKNIIFAIWGRISKNYLKFFLNRVDYITSMSYKEKEILEKNGIRKPIIVIHNSFEFPALGKNIIFKKTILFVGRLTPGKGVDLFLKVTHKLREKIPGYKFIFIGKGFLENKIKNVAKNDNNIILIGQIPHEEVSDFYKNASLVVVPSIWPEPLARVAIESLSFGTPVVVTNSGGLPEVIKDGIYGFVSKKNPMDLSEKITQAIKKNLVLRKNIHRDFNMIKKSFSTNIVLAHIKLYKKLLK